MQKDIVIGNETIPMKATAGTALRYRQVFGGDLLLELANVKKAKDITAVEPVQKLAYIMAVSAGENKERASFKDYMEWLDNFETVDLMKALPEVVYLYNASKAGVSTAKKK